MGYIAPVRMIQYTEYQKRDLEKTKTHDPIPVKFIPGIKLHSNSQLGTKTYTAATPAKVREIRDTEEVVFITDENFFEETGKGLYINEYV